MTPVTQVIVADNVDGGHHHVSAFGRYSIQKWFQPTVTALHVGIQKDEDIALEEKGNIKSTVMWSSCTSTTSSLTLKSLCYFHYFYWFLQIRFIIKAMTISYTGDGGADESSPNETRAFGRSDDSDFAQARREFLQRLHQMRQLRGVVDENDFVQQMRRRSIDRRHHRPSQRRPSLTRRQ